MGHTFRTVSLLKCLPWILVSVAARAAGEPPPFTVVGSPVDRGAVLARSSYDSEPTLLFDPDDPDSARRWKTWWLCDYQQGEADLEPYRGDDARFRYWTPGDRICFSTSADGDNWTQPPKIVLKGTFGCPDNSLPSGSCSADRPTDQADDHLVGSPSVLRLKLDRPECGPTGWCYVMFYEAYGNWASTLPRFSSEADGERDIWESPFPETGAANWVADEALRRGYVFETVLGVVPRYPKKGSRPMYGGAVEYAPDGKVNYFVSDSPVVSRTDESGVWKALNAGAPIFWLFISPVGDHGEPRLPVYTCWYGPARDTYLSNDPFCEPLKYPGVLPSNRAPLGFAITSESRAQELRYVLQNRVRLAISSDGEHWVRVTTSPELGDAFIAPLNPFGAKLGAHACADEQYSFAKSYGSGFPVALVRDELLEIFYTDDSYNFYRCKDCPKKLTLDEYDRCILECVNEDWCGCMDEPDPTNQPRCGRELWGWRLRVPIGRVVDWIAYQNAQREILQGAGVQPDIAWSPGLHHYISTNPELLQDAPCRQNPALRWGMPHPCGEWTRPSKFDNLLFLPSDASHWVADGGALARDGFGHALDVSASGAQRSLDLSGVYPAFPTDPRTCDDTDYHVPGRDLLGFAVQASYSAVDEDFDGVVDAADNCPCLANAGQEDSDGNRIGDECECQAAAAIVLGDPTVENANPDSGAATGVQVYLPDDLRDEIALQWSSACESLLDGHFSGTDSSVFWTAPTNETDAARVCTLTATVTCGSRSMDASVDVLINPLDSDQDGHLDVVDNDDDNDELLDEFELRFPQLGLDPKCPPLIKPNCGDEAGEDPDGDGYSNLKEQGAGTDPSAASDSPGVRVLPVLTRIIRERAQKPGPIFRSSFSGATLEDWDRIQPSQ